MYVALALADAFVVVVDDSRCCSLVVRMTP